MGQVTADVVTEWGDRVAELEARLGEVIKSKNADDDQVFNLQAKLELADVSSQTELSNVMVANGVDVESQHVKGDCQHAKEEMLTNQIKRLVAEKRSIASELSGLKSSFDEKVAECSSPYVNALLNTVVLPSEKHAVLVGLRSSPSLNGTVGKNWTMESWQRAMAS